MREQERGSTAARNRDEATQRGSAAARLVSMALLSMRSQQILCANACCLLLLCAPRFAIEGRLSGESSREWVRRPVSRRRALPRRCRRRPWRRRHRLERDPRPTDRQTDTHTQARIRRHRAPPSCVAAARRVSRQQRAAAARVAAARVAAAAACCVLQRTRRQERERNFAWKRRAAHGARAREHIVCSRAARAARAARLHEEKRACVCTVRVFVCVSCACVCACAVSVCVCVSQPALAAANALTARSAAVLA